MNTTEAAAQAKVTVSTIRTWCRRGIVAATKTGRRWIIDAASLAHRIDLAKVLRKTRPAVLTVENLIAIGGRLWEKNGMRRVYLNDWAALASLELSHYNSGNISSAAYQGEGISNRQASLILGAIDKVWYDAADGKLHARLGRSNPRIGRDQVWADTVAGIKTAVAAL